MTLPNVIPWLIPHALSALRQPWGGRLAWGGGHTEPDAGSVVIWSVVASVRVRLTMELARLPVCVQPVDTAADVTTLLATEHVRVLVVDYRVAAARLRLSPVVEECRHRSCAVVALHAYGDRRCPTTTADAVLDWPCSGPELRRTVAGFLLPPHPSCPGHSTVA